MAHADACDQDINRLNATWHYARAANFTRPRLLLPRQVSHTLPPPEAIVPYLREARFSDTVPLRNFVFDNSLIMTFVERWRPESHTFHLPWDVGVSGAATRCQASVVPKQGAQRKESVLLKLTWLCDRVRQMLQTDDSETLR
ncbi:uncharacterized protein DS421_18g620740 [Arachis hypogaea]|nr:uncharacterized protein DS421_18g620740 [Arachis hypogaea]